MLLAICYLGSLLAVCLLINQTLAWLQVLSDMGSSGIKMNSYIFTAFLQAITAVPLRANQLEAVFTAMASFRASQPASPFVYSSLLTFCAKQAADRALDVWHALQEVCCMHLILLCTDTLRGTPSCLYRHKVLSLLGTMLPGYTIAACNSGQGQLPVPCATAATLLLALQSA